MLLHFSNLLFTTNVSLVFWVPFRWLSRHKACKSVETTKIAWKKNDLENKETSQDDDDKVLKTKSIILSRHAACKECKKWRTVSYWQEDLEEEELFREWLPDLMMIMMSWCHCESSIALILDCLLFVFRGKTGLLNSLWILCHSEIVVDPNDDENKKTDKFSKSVLRPLTI